MHRRIQNKPSHPLLSFLPFSDGFTDQYNYTLYTSEFKRRGSEFLTNLISSASQQGRPFTCLVHTLLLPWAAAVARDFHLPRVMLWVQPATVFDILYYYFHGYNDRILENTKQSFELPGLPFMLTSSEVPSFLLPSCPPIYSMVTSMFEEQFHDLDMETNPIILVNTFEALEPEALTAVHKFNMIPIGPLIPSASLDGKDSTDTSFRGHIFQLSNDYVEWLDWKPDASVVYLSFGSFCMLSRAQMEEVARALLDCGYPFLWVIRENIIIQEKEEEELSCIEELKERGKIVKWCSQVEVLSHCSIGCFLTHCGWNSTMESLVCGVPMVAFPQWADQMMNAKFIEDVWKVGVRVNDDDGVVKGEEIRKCLDVVMENGERGNELRRNAKKWKDMGREAAKEGGSLEMNLRAFLDDVLEQCMPQKRN